MTAVNPARLRFQIQGLVSFFNAPVEFHQRLRDLFSLYANYALRFGEMTPSRPLIPMYHLPHPVKRQLILDLKPHIESNPEAALLIADQLWSDEYYEIKGTAILIIDALPLDDPQPILERLHEWLIPSLDNVLRTELLSAATHKLQKNFLEAWESLIYSLLNQTDPEMVALGIKGLSESTKDPDFKNLPAVFRLASPFIRNPHSAYIRDLEGLIEAMADLSPQETGYFIKQILSMSTSPETVRLVKSCLSAFPEAIQADLKSTLYK